MSELYRSLIPALWLGWAAYWWIASRHAKPIARRESVRSRLQHIVPLTLAAVLLALPALPVAPLSDRFLPFVLWPFWAGAALTAAGLSFTVWARVHLGGNWSGTVTLKENHELVTGGPYGIVRHPIYTGLLLGFAGSALARAEWRGVFAVVLAAWAFWQKLRLEEQWMHERFGDAYQAYAQRVAALLPFVL